MEKTDEQLYRHSNLGYTLSRATDDLLIQNQITPANAAAILSAFDTAIQEAFTQVRSAITFKYEEKEGSVIYRNVENIWTFVYPKMSIQVADKVIHADKVKIIVVDKKQDSRKKKVAKAPKTAAAADAAPADDV
eukprot:a1034_599.p3 GENE.a1034_599~~a1034_599.p3  ORF type:complete len:142 (+),score=47.57 a1034_599:27-428(+)